MSKSFGNCIWLDDEPNDMFGKAMSIPDDVMDEWVSPLWDADDRPIHPEPMKRVN
jgi:tyrosyl-tRNA synthetase